MPTKEYKRPDETTLLRAIEKNQQYSAGLILRLAWKMGLSREEIRQLTWSNIDFSTMELTLPGRRTPIDEETGALLKRRFDAWSAGSISSEFVVVSDRAREQMSLVRISRVVRAALDAEGITDISIEALRQDYVIRNLEEHGLVYTARVSGQAVSSLYNNYSQFVPKKEANAAPAQSEMDEYLLWQLMQKEGASPVGLVLHLIWQAGLQVHEVLNLTWEQVDLKGGTIRLRDRVVPVGAALKRLLQQVKDDRPPAADPHVLLSPRAQKPYDAPRISSVTKTALIRAGMKGVTLETLVRKRRWKTGDEEILRMSERTGSVTRRDVEALLQVTKAQAYKKLNRLADEGKLVQVGAKYYRAGAVVPPEEHYEKIAAHLKDMGASYRKELADILRLEAKQCSWILQKLVAEGKLIRTGQRYDLPQGDA